MSKKSPSPKTAGETEPSEIETSDVSAPTTTDAPSDGVVPTAGPNQRRIAIYDSPDRKSWVYRVVEARDVDGAKAFVDGQLCSHVDETSEGDWRFAPLQ